MSKELFLKLKVDDENVIKSIEKLEDKTDDVNKNMKDTNKSMKNMGGETKKVGKGLSSWTKVLNTAGILAVITMIVKAFQKIGNLLMKNSKFAASFKRVMAGINAIFEKAIDLIVESFGKIPEFIDYIQNSKLGKTLSKFFTDPVEAIKDLGKMINNAIISRIEGLKAIGPAIAKIFKGDLKEGFKDLGDAGIQYITGIKDGTDKIKGAVDMAADGVKNLSKTFKEAGLSAADLEKQTQNFRRAEVASIEEIAKRESEISELKLKSKNLEKFTEKERLEFLQEAQRLERVNLNRRIELKREEIRIETEKQAITSSSIEDEERLANMKAELYQFEVDANGRLESQESEISAMKMSNLEREKQAIQTLQDLKLENMEDENERAMKALSIQEERALQEAEQYENSEQIKTEIKEKYERLRAEKEEEIRDQTYNKTIEDLDNFLDQEFQMNREQFEKEMNAKMEEDLRKLEQEGATQEQIAQLEKEYEDRKTEYIKNKEKEKNRAREEGLKSFESTTGSITQSISNLHNIQKEKELEAAGDNEEKKEQIRKKYAQKEKDMSLTKAIISGALAVTRAAAIQPFIPAGLIAMGVAATQTGAQIASIRAQKFSRGGEVNGPGTSTSDSIPARLSNGESVINARSTKMFRNELSEMNVAGGGVPFARGGIAGQTGSMNEDSNSIAKNITDSIKQIPVMVSETDITDTQKKVQVVKTESKL
ncbi:MAG: hypothetical protein ACOCRX_08245 [Candidatus Woesearchaeota archaeon]